jgi:hypothetical protein
MVVVLGFLSRQVKIGRMLLPTGLDFLEGPAGEIHCAINARRLLDWVFSVMRTHIFYLTVWFQRERFEALLAVNFMELVFFPWSWRRSHESRDRWKSNGGRNLMVRWNWLGAS